MYISKQSAIPNRPKLVDINSDETLFYPFTISVNTCGESCNPFNDPYPRISVQIKCKIWI